MKYDEWRRRCPYGIWTCRDGREVLFNRMYWPILERPSPSLPARPADPNEWVHWIEQEHFFNDGNPPWATGSPGKARLTLKRINAVLIAWGYPALPPAPKPGNWIGPLVAVRFGHLRVPPRLNPYAE